MLVALFSIVSLASTQDHVVITPNEPRQADYRSTDLEVRCGARTVSLTGIGGSGPRFRAPSANLNSRRINLPSDLQNFLLAERATYRVFATCPDTSPAFQLRIHRAVGSHEGVVAYTVRAVDVNGNGRIVDHGTEPTDAESFWIR